MGSDHDRAPPSAAACVLLAALLLAGDALATDPVRYAHRILPVDVAGRFGTAVSTVGDVALVTAPDAPSEGAYLGTFSGVDWSVRALLVPDDGSPIAGARRFGTSAIMSSRLAVVGCPNDDVKGRGTGSVFVYEFDVVSSPSTLTPSMKWVTPSTTLDSFFGSSLAILDTGADDLAWIAVAAPNDGPALYPQAGLVWLCAYNVTSHECASTTLLESPQRSAVDNFGSRVEFCPRPSGDVELLVGATGENNGRGRVFRFLLVGGFAQPSWVPLQTLDFPAADSASSRSKGFGRAFACSDEWLVVSSRLDAFAGTNSPEEGAATIFHRNPATSPPQFSAVSVLRGSSFPAVSGVPGLISFGSAVAMAGEAMVVAAPDADGLGVVKRGTVLGFRRVNNRNDSTSWVSVVQVFHDWEAGEVQRPAVLTDAGFGTSLAMTRTHFLSGAPFSDGSRGRVLGHGGIEIFPIPLPVLDPTGGTYFRNESLPVKVIAASNSLRAHATFDGSAVNSFLPFLEGQVTDIPSSIRGGGGGILLLPLPVRDVTYQVQAIASNPFEPGSASPIVPATYYVAAPTKGYFWDPVGSHLEPCGNVSYFCPGAFVPNDRRRVQPAFYSTPLTEPENTRWGELECEANFVCEDGRRSPCGAAICWPQLTRVEAREARAGERGPANEDWFALRRPGVSPGDVLEFEFDVPTNGVALPDLAAVASLFRFSVPLGARVSTRWLSPTRLDVTLVEGPWHQNPFGSDASRFYSLNQVLSLTVLQGGGLRRERNISARSQSDVPFFVTGTWGAFPPPEVASVEAMDGGLHSQPSVVPGTADRLVLFFASPPQLRPVRSSADVLALVELSADVAGGGTRFSGQWTAAHCARQAQRMVVHFCFPALEITFDEVPVGMQSRVERHAFGAEFQDGAVLDEVAENLWLDAAATAFAPPRLQARVRASAQLTSEDESSARAQGLWGASFGDWGAVPEGLSLVRADRDCATTHWARPREVPLARLATFECEAVLLERPWNETAGEVWASGIVQSVVGQVTQTGTQRLTPTTHPAQSAGVAFFADEYAWRVCPGAQASAHTVLQTRCRARYADDLGDTRVGPWAQALPRTGLSMGPFALESVEERSRTLHPSGRSLRGVDGRVEVRLHESLGYGRHARNQPLGGRVGDVAVLDSPQEVSFALGSCFAYQHGATLLCRLPRSVGARVPLFLRLGGDLESERCDRLASRTERWLGLDPCAARSVSYLPPRLDAVLPPDAAVQSAWLSSVQPFVPLTRPQWDAVLAANTTASGPAFVLVGDAFGDVDGLVSVSVRGSHPADPTFPAACVIAVVDTALACRVPELVGAGPHEWSVVVGRQSAQPWSSSTGPPLVDAVRAFSVPEQLVPRNPSWASVHAAATVWTRAQTVSLLEAMFAEVETAQSPLTPLDQLPSAPREAFVIVHARRVGSRAQPAQVSLRVASSVARDPRVGAALATTVETTLCAVVRDHEVVACLLDGGFGEALAFVLVVAGQPSPVFPTSLDFRRPRLERLALDGPEEDLTSSVLDVPRLRPMRDRAPERATTAQRWSRLRGDAVPPTRHSFTWVTTCSLPDPGSPVQATVEAELDVLQGWLGSEGTAFLAANPQAPADLIAALRAVSARDASLARHSALTARGYLRPEAWGGGFVGPRGGHVFAIGGEGPHDRAGGTCGVEDESRRPCFPFERRDDAEPLLPLWNVGMVAEGTGVMGCAAWVEPLVEVPTSPGWIVLGARNLGVSGLGRLNETANVSSLADPTPASSPVASSFEWGLRAVVALEDGEEVDPRRLRVHGDGLLEFYHLGGVGRRRLQLLIGGRASNGLVLVHAVPIVHGVLEAAAGSNDATAYPAIEGEEAEGVGVASGRLNTTNNDHVNATESSSTPSLSSSADTWGGPGAWDAEGKCSRITLAGFHMGSEADRQAGLVEVWVGFRDPCKYVADVRHVRLLCCARSPTSSLQVLVGGQVSAVVSLNTSLVNRMPSIQSVSPSALPTAGDWLLTLAGRALLPWPFRVDRDRSNETAPLPTSNVDDDGSLGGGGASTVGPPAALDPAADWSASTHESAAPAFILLYAPEVEELLPNPQLARIRPSRSVDEGDWFQPTVSLATLGSDDPVASAAAAFWTTIAPRPPPASLIELIPSEREFEPNLRRVEEDDGALTTLRVLSPRALGPGYFVRVAVASTVDRGFHVSPRVWIPTLAPRLLSLFPYRLPLTGGLVSLFGRDFGENGTVRLLQRRGQVSSAAPPGHTFVPPDTTAAWAARGARSSHFWGGWRVGDGLPYAKPRPRPSSVEDAARDDRRATIETDSDVHSDPSPPWQRRWLADSFTADPEDTHVVSECRVVAWTDARIDCLAPPGLDNETVVLVSVPWSETSAAGLLEYAVDLPCFYNSTLDGVAIEVHLPTFWEQVGAGLWIGVLFGLLLVGTVVLAYRCIHRHRLPPPTLPPTPDLTKGPPPFLNDTTAVLPASMLLQTSAIGANPLLQAQGDEVERLTRGIRVTRTRRRRKRGDKDADLAPIDADAQRGMAYLSADPAERTAQLEELKSILSTPAERGDHALPHDELDDFIRRHSLEGDGGGRELGR